MNLGDYVVYQEFTKNHFDNAGTVAGFETIIADLFRVLMHRQTRGL